MACGARPAMHVTRLASANDVPHNLMISALQMSPISRCAVARRVIDAYTAPVVCWHCGDIRAALASKHARSRGPSGTPLQYLAMSFLQTVAICEIASA